MAFEFPDPNVTSEFEAANGIVYSWDATDEKWVVKAYKSKDGEYLPLTGGKLTGRLSIDKEREDKNTIAFSVAGRVKNNIGAVVPDILFKSYQRDEANSQPDYMAYYGSSGGANEILNRVTAQNEFADKTTVDDALSIQATVITDIQTLQQEVDALENTRYVGTWNAIDDSSKNGRSPGDGNFYFNQGSLATDWSLVGWIYIANVDSNGIEFTHSDIQAGDQIEVISKSETSYGIYTIQDKTDANGYVAIQIEVMNRSEGVPAVGPHLIKIFSISNGINLDEADDRYLRKTGGTMTGSIEIDKPSGTSIILKKDGTSNLKFWPDGTAETTKTTFSDNHFVTKDYVDTAIDGVVGPDSTNFATLNTEQTFTKSADKTILSEFTFNRDQGETAVRFFLNNEQAAQIYYDSAVTTRLQVEEGKEFKIVTVPEGGSAQQVLKTYTDGGIRLEQLKAPQQNHHAATKAYVDSVLAAPARLAWKWDSTSSGDSAPAAGAFKYTTNGGDHYYRFSLETYQGVKLGESIISEFNRTIDNGPAGTIWYKDANGWKFKQQFRINTFRWNYNNHFEFRVTSRNGSTTFTPGTPYYITIGGFF